MRLKGDIKYFNIYKLHYNNHNILLCFQSYVPQIQVRNVIENQSLHIETIRSLTI